MISLNNNEVKAVLPQRAPILLIDTANELIPGQSVKTKTFIDPNWEIFKGHFPSAPVLPGVFIVEAMAQAADIMLLTLPENKNKTPFFLSINRVRFLRQILPGETIEIEATLSCDAGGGMYDCSAAVFTNGKKAATGNISIAMR